MPFIIIFGTLSFPINYQRSVSHRRSTVRRILRYFRVSKTRLLRFFSTGMSQNFKKSSAKVLSPISPNNFTTFTLLIFVVCQLLSVYVARVNNFNRNYRGRNAIFGHVARLPDNIPAHQAMLRQVELSVGRPPDPTWKRPPGRPRTKWTDQLHRDNNNVPIATLWRQAIGRGHSRATLRSEPTTR